MSIGSRGRQHQVQCQYRRPEYEHRKRTTERPPAAPSFPEDETEEVQICRAGDVPLLERGAVRGRPPTGSPEQHRRRRGDEHLAELHQPVVDHGVPQVEVEAGLFCRVQQDRRHRGHGLVQSDRQPRTRVAHLGQVEEVQVDVGAGAVRVEVLQPRQVQRVGNHAHELAWVGHQRRVEVVQVHALGPQIRDLVLVRGLPQVPGQFEDRDVLLERRGPVLLLRKPDVAVVGNPDAVLDLPRRRELGHEQKLPRVVVVQRERSDLV
mmetsp:Transcript_6181/g.15337  ORF Transcript_6181/g.15337 Transcript_6181/m.15337 type:complete len:264 (-) Transcript_6181:3537-4328(-)